MRFVAAVALSAALVVIAASTSVAGTTPASGVAPPPDTYAGRFELYIDNVFAGPLASLDGCQANLVRTEVTDPRTGQKVTRIQPMGYLPCELTLGFNVPTFFDWLNKTVLPGGGRPPTHNVRIVQFVCLSTCAATKDLAISQALITGFTVLPIDGLHHTAAYFGAEIQSQDQDVRLETATGASHNAVPQPIDTFTLNDHIDRVGSTTSKPIVVTTAPYAWSLQVTRSPSPTGSGFILRTGATTTSDVSALVATGKALTDLRTWQAEPVMRPRTGDLSVAAGVAGPRLTLTFTGLMLVQPVDPFERLQSQMFRWGEHADGLTIAVH
jgi:hypothetical protein